jgi:hypothetical protein
VACDEHGVIWGLLDADGNAAPIPAGLMITAEAVIADDPTADPRNARHAVRVARDFLARPSGPPPPDEPPLGAVLGEIRGRLAQIEARIDAIERGGRP